MGRNVPNYFTKRIYYVLIYGTDLFSVPVKKEKKIYIDVLPNYLLAYRNIQTLRGLL